MKKTHIFILTIFFATFSNAKCVYPVPDGSEEKISDRNLAGHLIQKNEQKIIVKDYASNKLVSIRLSRLEHAYSAFGGDEEIKKLNIGIAVRIWYKFCRNSAKPEAAYIEYFSNNNADQPKNLYFTQSGQ
ncbi:MULTISPECIES: hypothetical protein [unclassified Acidovorax]|uniref:hypothetical protein n=1 Tax=unclassified Acidovorax TaxID=2684926 RepID=UPI000AC63071|nr:MULTISPECIES: hypothetical protein [unclassified Acidovorax]